jgi:hypothetical protein
LILSAPGGFSCLAFLLIWVVSFIGFEYHDKKKQVQKIYSAARSKTGLARQKKTIVVAGLAYTLPKLVMQMPGLTTMENLVSS